MTRGDARGRVQTRVRREFERVSSPYDDAPRDPFAAAILTHVLGQAVTLAVFLLGGLVMAYNLAMTILGHEREEAPIGGAVAQPAPSLQSAG